jgi:methyl-accepting chemotaxis protein
MILQYYELKTEKSVHKQIQDGLQMQLNYKLNAKKSIGLTNAISIANDGRIRKSLRTGDRKWAIISLNDISKKMKKDTKFKNVKVHVHTKDNISFIRNWKLKKYGDDLSSFRASVVKVNQIKSPVNTFEVGKAGLSLRSVAPVTDDNGNHLGSLEFMQGLNSVAKAFDKSGDAFLFLMDETLKKAPIPSNKQYKNYAISQKFINTEFLTDAKGINLTKLLKEKVLLTDKYLYTYQYIKDFNGKKLGIALVASPIEKVNVAIDASKVMINIALTIIISLVLFILAIITYTISRVVISPLTSLNDAIVNLIKTKDTSSRIKVLSNDEIGDISNNFNLYLQSIEDGIKEDKVVIEEAEIVINRVKNGWYSQHIESSTSNPTVNQFKNSINDMIKATKKHIQDINQRLEEYAHLNYTNELKLEGIEKSGVMELLVNDINKLRESITTTLIENKANGLTLQNSSNALLSNVDTLNTSSNEAAASLEETAAALEEITSNISSTTNNVIEMSNYASELNQSASTGQNLASQTTNAMDEINNEVTSISEAITVIDQIAFQTNILSLNAAVEAATAGEAGKGFAVVAQEVRNLAARSAEAANEIKTLVESATSKANQGKDIADKMIEGYNGLNENISRTIDLINDVETSSKEQQAGIIQINDAVNALDRQTQQNASVASDTKDIAVQTQSIAQEIVKDADEKEFNGKNEVRAKQMSIAVQTPSRAQNVEKVLTQPQTKKETVTTLSSTNPSKDITPITATIDEDDEWASF